MTNLTAAGNKPGSLRTSLHWVKPPEMLQLLASATVTNGQHIAVKGTGYYTGVPQEVKILRAYTPFIKAIRSTVKLPKYADLNDIIPVHKISGEDGCIGSNIFPLTARGFLHTQRWICRDPDGTSSPLLRTSRFVDVSIEELGAQVRGSRLVRIRARVASPKDPIVDLSIVTPNQPHDRCSFSDALESHAKEALLDSHKLRGPNIAETQDYLHAKMEDYLQQPSHWQIWVHPSRLRIAAGSEADIQIYVIPGKPGKLPLAVVAAGNRTSDLSVSNIIILDQDEDGHVRMLYGQSQQPDQSGYDPQYSFSYEDLIKEINADMDELLEATERRLERHLHT